MEKMNPKIKARWIEALRSRQYKQGKGVLRDADNKFCCLGVLCNLHAQDHATYAKEQTERCPEGYLYGDASGFPPASVSLWSGVRDEAQGDLAGMNDRGQKFYQIARWIERNL